LFTHLQLPISTLSRSHETMTWLDDRVLSLGKPSRRKGSCEQKSQFAGELTSRRLKKVSSLANSLPGDSKKSVRWRTHFFQQRASPPMTAACGLGALDFSADEARFEFSS
jgi:hypothetical protein